MHILVTGGAGFIGSNTVDLLLERGHRVRVLDNFYSGKRENLQPHAALQVFDGDIRDVATVEQAMAGVTHVLHLAAQVFVPTSIEQPVMSGSVNIAGFLNVLDAARRLGNKRVVYASSAAVYGLATALPLTEASLPMALSPYALEKLVDDQYAQLFAQLYGTSACGLRYFNVYGPRQDPRSPYSGVISKFCSVIAAGERLCVLGDGLQTRDFIAVQDVARANLAALESDVTGVVNVATGTSVTLLQLIAALCDVLGRVLPVDHAPPRAGEVRLSEVMPKRLRDELHIADSLPLRDGLAALLHSLGLAP
jgi:UDP-glucose 4-epimerase